jgi:hypothetical protein
MAKLTLGPSKKMQSEYDQLISEIGKTTVVWNQLEMALFAIFSTLVEAKPTDQWHGVVFFSPNSFDARLNMVNDLMALKYADDRVAKVWSTTKGKIHNKQRVRNSVAHHVIGTAAMHDGQYIRLMPALGDHLRHLKTRKKNQPPGLGVDELKAFRESLGPIFEDLNIIDNALKALRGFLSGNLPSMDEAQGLHGALLRLDALANCENSQSHNPLGNPPPDEPSQG